MTVTEQCVALEKIGCDDAIEEIKASNNQPLAPGRFEYYLTQAINDGLPGRVEALAGMIKRLLTAEEVERLIKRCFELGDTVSALYATGLGPISEQTHSRLIEALIAEGHAKNREEAIEALNEQRQIEI